uniref:Lipid-A-disaccharide synthase n=1 Tax=Solibacter usitatus (strain Ellin6076) TaxID=234267 RepID=LPXB_SOLUE|nr:RecName: Full=Lipid-A-disaccharide synthase [Candidatus Solibacter usitatus Ellin6076]
MPKILVSAGEASGDLYASLVVQELRRIMPDAEFFGCTGPRLRAAGVRTIVDSADLAVVGLIEVVAHIPRIYGEFRKLLRAAREERPLLAILTDSPDFHLRVARKLHRQEVPVVYLVAPQAWAWRRGRVREMRRTIRRLLCIFPFEEEFFRRYGVPATYIGHPLAGLVHPALSREEFFKKHRLAAERPLVSVLPGSRRGEAARHIPALLDAVDRIYREQAVNVVLPASATTGVAFFQERMGNSPIRVIEGESWDAMAHSDLALAASGTVTVEAALLGTPMVTFYKVTGVSWLAGKFLVDIPFYSMVNLIAGRAVVPELMQSQMTGENLAREALRLLQGGRDREEMKAGLAQVKEKLAGRTGAPGRAALAIQEILEGQVTHVS